MNQMSVCESIHHPPLVGNVALLDRAQQLAGSAVNGNRVSEAAGDVNPSAHIVDCDPGRNEGEVEKRAQTLRREEIDALIGVANIGGTASSAPHGNAVDIGWEAAAEADVAPRSF